VTYPDPAHPSPYGAPPQQPVPAPRIEAPKRPGSVTAAAVICFVWAVINLIFAAFVALAVAVSQDRTDGSKVEAFGGTGAAFGYGWSLLTIIVCIAMVWGGIAALRGKSNKILVITGVALLLLNVVSLIIVMAGGSGSFLPSILGVVLPGFIVSLVRTQQAKQFFISRGGTAL
jgi:hypothetical protein